MSGGLSEDLKWLYSLENMGIKLGLSNVRSLLAKLGDPHESFASVHVAGSNGKGSVCAMTESVLRAEGYRTGLYTSPHLVRFTERVRVDGKEMPEPRLAKMISELRGLVEGNEFPRPLTFFEITTALAFLHFAEQGVEEAVVEVGMGGRLDATNVVDPQCCVVTRISQEHTSFLGDTLPKVAYEKASIIKEGVPAISSPQHPGALSVIKWMARCRSSRLKVMGEDFHGRCARRGPDGVTVELGSLGTEVDLGLLGGYQCENAAVAAECCLTLSDRIELSIESIARGLSSTRWPGRLDVVSREPLTVLDVSHTPEGAAAVARELDVFSARPKVLVVGMLKDKDARGAMSALAPHFDVVLCTAPGTSRALSPEEMREACALSSRTCRAVDGVGNALREARGMAGREGMVMVCGSLYTVGEAMRYLEGEHGP